MKIVDLIDTLEYELAQPPAKAGLRLASEHLLASLYGVSRMKARRSLDVLVERGYLVRRHGSGTYLRKIPITVSLPQNYTAVNGSIFSQDESVNQKVRLQPESGQQQLTLGFWSDLHSAGGEMNQLLWGGIKQRVIDLGHKLQSHSSVHKMDVPLSSTELEEQLRDSSCDGYAIVARWSAQFLEAVNRVWPNERPPIVYIWPGSVLTSLEPLIHTDTQQAAERAVLHLIDGGFHRIGLIDTNAVLSHARHRIGYEVAMASADLSSLPPIRLRNDDAFCQENIKATNQWLDQIPDLEAVCVMSETLLPFLIDQFALRGQEIGIDIGVVTISNCNCDLPKGLHWSCMEFDPGLVGAMAVDSLVQTIVTAGRSLHSFSHQACWRPGKTHLRKQPSSNNVDSKPLARRALSTGALI